MKPCMAVASILLLTATFLSHAQTWKFSSPLDVTATNASGVFHHLESSGRRNIVATESLVAVAWEDNRNGSPQIYLARKALSAKDFTAEIKVSGGGEAYEPSLLALDNDRFVVAWEEDGRIRARIVTANGPGPILTLGLQDASQVSLIRQQQLLLLVYSQVSKKHRRVWLQALQIQGQSLRSSQSCPVDVEPAKDDQLYPTIVSQGDRIVTAWEDRRPGYTIIMAAQSHNKSPCKFSSPQRISAALPMRTSAFGKGHGVARVALAAYGAGQTMAVWADKRDFREGYDIYAARYQPGKKLFGVNSKVQDSFGDVAQQWHPAIAGNSMGQIVVAWDDNRDGDANIMLSRFQDNKWSDDIEVAPASGQGEQTHPSIYLDEDNNLHLVWIERIKIGGPTRLRYAFARATK